jgi:hypothetical protein
LKFQISREEKSGTQVGKNTFVRMANDNGSVMSEAETRRRQELRQKYERELRAQKWDDIRRRFFRLVRGVFVFLLGAAIVILLVWHRRELDALAAAKLKQAASLVHASGSAPIQKDALDYEKEVNDAAGK